MVGATLDELRDEGLLRPPAEGGHVVGEGGGAAVQPLPRRRHDARSRDALDRRGHGHRPHVRHGVREEPGRRGQHAAAAAARCSSRSPTATRTPGLLAARRFAELGFSIAATAGTADDARGATASRSTRSSPRSARTVGVDAVDLISSGKVDLVVNTPRGRGPRADGMHIRRAAIVPRRRVRHDGRGRARRRGRASPRSSTREPEVRSLQEYHRDGQLRLERVNACAPARGAATAGVDLARRRSGRCTLPNPIVAASGTFGHGAEVARAVRPARLGAVTVKSVAAFAWTGNPPLRVTEAPGGGMLNSVGLPGPGVDAWIARRPPRARSARRARHRVDLGPHGRGVRGGGARRCEAVARPRRRGRGQPVVPERRRRARDVFAHAPRRDARGVAAVRRRARRRAAGVREAVAERHRHRRRSRAPRSTPAPTGLTLVNTVMGLVDRRRARARRARRGRRRALGPPIKPIALRAVCEVTRARSRVRRSSAPVASRPASDAVEMLLAGRDARSASAPRRSPTRARRCASSTSSTRGARRNGVARVARPDGGVR